MTASTRPELRAESGSVVTGRPTTLETGAVQVRGLSIHTTGKPPIALVDDVSFVAEPGEAVGIVGESGSGKSLTLRAVLGLLPVGVQQTSGDIAIGGRVGMVFQDPLTALDPLATVGSQISAAARASAPEHTARRGRSAHSRAQALDLMRAVHLPDPESRYDWYPFQLSGGQRQRVVIALALATRPDVLLCDEPTTALDVTVQAQILALLRELQRDLGLTLLFVSHNLAVVAGLCSRIAVMRAGRIVESGETAQVVSRPRDPYTQSLLNAVLPVPAVGVTGGGDVASAGAGAGEVSLGEPAGAEPAATDAGEAKA